MHCEGTDELRGKCIDAIHKCNAYTSKKERMMDSSDMAGQQHAVPPDHSISLDHILSNIPYKDMLQDLFGLNAGEQG